MKYTAISICLICLVGIAKANDDPSELLKLRMEYRKKADSEITPINKRYLNLLKRLEKSYSRSNEDRKSMAVRLEIEALQENPAHLVVAEKSSSAKDNVIGLYKHPKFNGTAELMEGGKCLFTHGNGSTEKGKWKFSGDNALKLVYDNGNQRTWTWNEEDEVWLYESLYPFKRLKLPSLTCALTVVSKDEDANIYFKGSSIRLKLFANIFDQGWGGQVGSVPEDFDNVEMTGLKMKKKDNGQKGFYPIHVPVTFKVKKPGKVYIVVSSKASAPFVKDGWIVVDNGTWGWNAKYTRKYQILNKILEKGEYTLPPSEGFGTRVIDK